MGARASDKICRILLCPYIFSSSRYSRSTFPSNEFMSFHSVERQLSTENMHASCYVHVRTVALGNFVSLKPKVGTLIQVIRGTSLVTIRPFLQLHE